MVNFTQAPDPAAGRHRDAGAGQPGAAGRAVAPPLVPAEPAGPRGSGPPELSRGRAVFGPPAPSRRSPQDDAIRCGPAVLPRLPARISHARQKFPKGLRHAADDVVRRATGSRPRDRIDHPPLPSSRRMTMSLRINTNVEAFNAHRQLAATVDRAGEVDGAAQLGFRINRAADDAAGLAISEKLRGQIRGLAQASATRRTASRSCRRRRARSTRCTRCCSASASSPSSTSNGTLSTVRQGRDHGRGRPAGSGDRPHRQLRRSSTASRCSTARPGRSRSRSAPTTATSSPSRRRPLGTQIGTIDVSTAGAMTSRDRHRDQQRQHDALHLRRGPEPPRAHPEQLCHLPGEPDRLREPHPRRGHGLGDGQLHARLQILQQAGTSMLAQANQSPQGVLSLLRG